MLPKKTRRPVYALLLIALSIVGTSAIANTKVYELFTTVTKVIENSTAVLIAEEFSEESSTTSTQVSTTNKDASFASAPMFMTIIQGADEEVACSNDGSTVARFNLCGDFDDRTISLSQAGATYEWQQFNPGGSCTFDVNDDCPNNTNTCWSTIATGTTFDLDASTISSGTGGEFRVRVDGGSFFYFKVKKSTITQTFVKTDFICGVPGRIQITNLSSAYEYSIDSGAGFGPWQTSPIFDGLVPGTYVVKARLQNTPNTCEYPYEPIVIDQLDIDIDVTFVDAQCFGETGSITVNVNNVPGPYKYTLLDELGVPQEFTTFIPDNPYTFAAVGFGTYSIQVETQQCAGDPGNGIPAPRQDLDTSGNPIIIGDGLVALSASTEVNNSLSSDPTCGANDVDIIVRTSGGAPPYTFTVSDGGNSGGSYATDTTYNVTAAGSYDFTITDSNGCIITASASVAELTPPDVTVSGIDGTCTNGGARLDITIVDAKGYNLSFRATPGDPWSTNPLLSVPDGTYNSIQVLYEQGAFNCIFTIPTSVTVTNIGVIVGSVVKIQDRSCNLAGGVDGGIIEFQPPYSGGSGSGYEFSIDGSNFSTQENYPNLLPGTYTPIIRDAGGCRLELTPITILDVDPPSDIDFVQSNTNCAANTSDVQLTATSSAAIATYEIISPITLNNGASDTFVGLTNNTNYTFRITDVNNCQYEENFTPAVISSIRARVKSGGDLRVCTGDADGTGTFIIDGFANTYTYDINGTITGGPQNDQEVDLPPSGAGTYTITVTDTDTGCTDTASFTIEEPAAPLTLTGNVNAMSCANNNVGRVVGISTGGWGTNRYTLLYPNGSTVGPNSSRVFGNLTLEGNYTLSVEDAEGCTATFDFTLSAIDAPTLSLDAGASDFCYVPSTGGATMVVTSTAGTAALASHQYRINGGVLQGSPTFTNLSPGNYTIEVVDGNNCSDTINVTVRPQLRVTTSIIAEIPCGGADGTIRVQATGGYLSGAGPKQYEVSGDNGASFGAPIALSSNTFLFDTNVPGDYVFRVTDNQGCVAVSTPITLATPENIDPASANVTPASCGLTNNGIVNVIPDATSGIPPYEVSWDGGAFGSQTLFSNLNAGQTYTYVVRDARGCETVAQTVTIPLDGTAPPDATVAPITATCLTGTVEGGVEVTGVAGGTADFTYILTDQFGTEIARVGPTASTTHTFGNLAPGTYTVQTIDALGCTDVDTVTITQTTVDVVPDPVPLPTCDVTGFTNTVEIFGGVGPFLIRLVGDPSAPVSPNIPPRRHTFTGLQFGVTYTVEVTDVGTGCVYFDEIPPQDGPTTLDVAATSTPGFCDVNRNGQISYDVSGFAAGSDLIIELLDTDTGTRITLESPTNVSPIYSNTFETLPGNYQIIVTDLTDNCTDATPVVVDQNLPAIVIVSQEPANCNAFGQITVQGSGGDGGPYTFAYMDTGVTPTPGDYTTETTFVAAAGSYDVYVMDSSGCTSFAIATIINLDPDLPAPTISVDNQCDVTTATFDITVSMPVGVDTPRFTLGGVTLLTNPATFTVNSPGDYTIDVVDANGCTSTGIATVYEFLSAFGDFTTMPNCNNADGEITITTNGGSGDFSFELRDGAGTPITTNTTGVFTGFAPGDYEVMVTDNLVSDLTGNCTFLVDNITLDAAVVPVIVPLPPENVSCNGADDGSIDIVLQPGTDVDSPIDYRLLNFDTRALISNNNSGSFPNLPPGRYEVEVVTARNCSTLSGLLEITEPLPFSISASAPDFICDPGANTFSSTIITATIVDPGTAAGGYQYSITGFSNYQTSNTFEIIDNGSPQNITVYAIDGNGCQTTFAVPTINPPTTVVPSITDSDALTCAAPERVEITVTGTTNFNVIVDPAVPGSPFNSGGSATVDVFLPNAGDYLFVIEDLTGGCFYPMPVYTVSEPISPTVVISEAAPVICDGDTDGALFIEVTDYTGVYNYDVFLIDNLGNRIVPAVTSGSFDTTNFPDASGDPARITGLPGGNFIVDVQSVADPQCPGTSNVATVRAPNGVLDVTATEEGNVSCNDNTGRILAVGSGGWDTAPYNYRLLQDDGSGTYPTEVVALSTTDTFSGLSSGDYRVEIVDVEGCTDSFDITLSAIPPIQAGIREPQGLVCPAGNNAILEAYDPSTGDVITATPGATGGVPGAGYLYQLIYLGSNDILDELSRSGLQASPTFVGPSGDGYISAGWYAIEVSSSFDCVGVTVPYFVDPPPAIIPNLVQVQAPGCGGQGQMELSIANPEVGFDYEYRIVGSLPADPYIPMGVGITSVLLSEGPGFYQYEVRKITATNACAPVVSNGLTLIDAQNLDLVVNAPDDISCAADLDGRIESFASGGVGGNQFYLYLGDPGDAFSPNAGATLVRGPQADGTFEGLAEGTDYYVAVTSGITCQRVVGPVEIERPAPIVFNATPAPVSCNGEEDGVIAIEVTSGGEGLIQFAISPNFNEFFNDPATPGLYTFDELAAGDYDILIQDAAGCSEIQTVTVTEPIVLGATFTSTNETCIGFEDGSAQITVTGGTPFVDGGTGAQYYETALNSSDPADFVRNDNLFYDNLVGGDTYVVFIRDANGCETNVIIPIELGVDLVATPVVDYGCDGIFPNSTVTIDIEDPSLIPDLLFFLRDNNSGTPPLTETERLNQADTQRSWGDLTPSDYTVFIYHSNGCSIFVDFTVDAYDPLTLDAMKTGPNEITATATGGYGNYEFFFNDESFGSTNIFTINFDANVSVRVVDERGCEATLVFPFDFDGMIEIPNFFTPDGDNNNDEWFPRNREFFPNIEVKIYDRYGRVVAILDQIATWDGTYEGKELPTGDYWYVVNQNDRENTQYVGHFTLYR